MAAEEEAAHRLIFSPSLPHSLIPFPPLYALASSSSTSATAGAAPAAMSTSSGGKKFRAFEHLGREVVCYRLRYVRLYVRDRVLRLEISVLVERLEISVLESIRCAYPAEHGRFDTALHPERALLERNHPRTPTRGSSVCLLVRMHVELFQVLEEHQRSSNLITSS